MITFYVILFIALLVVVVSAKVHAARGGAAASARLRGYGIVVDGDEVKSHGKVLGPLAGARAEITDGTSRHTITRVVTVVGALTKKTKAFVIVSTANGGFNQYAVDGAAAVRAAQAWVVRFNTLAATAQLTLGKAS